MAFNWGKITGNDEEKKDEGIGSKSNVEKLAGEIADMNYNDFTKGDEYKDLAKRYSDQGKLAMDDTIGQVSARTGGLASSYAVGAGNQAYNGYMQKLEDAARSLYDSERSEKKDNLSIAQGIYAQDYQEKRDEVADSQWEKSFRAQSSVNSHNATMDYLNRADVNNAADQSEAQNKLLTYLASMTPTEISQKYPDLMETAGWDTAYLTACQATLSNEGDTTGNEITYNLSIEDFNNLPEDAFISDGLNASYRQIYGTDHPNYFEGLPQTYYNLLLTLSKDNREHNIDIWVAQKFISEETSERLSAHLDSILGDKKGE